LIVYSGIAVFRLEKISGGQVPGALEQAREEGFIVLPVIFKGGDNG
jgi:hypothetical protein